MNREIKFRAWNKKEKYMEIADDLQMFSNDLSIGIPSKDYFLRKDDVELMQYTGLNDKNGKEIYEGDIVKIYGHCFDFGFKQEEIGQIKFIHGAFGFYREKSKNEYCFNNLETEEAYGELDYYEVIGNIYDNPELLGGENGI